MVHCSALFGIIAKLPCPSLTRLAITVSLNLFLTLTISLDHARQEPQRGLEKHSRGALKHFTRLLWGENFWIFLFKMVHSGVLYICGQQWGPKHHGARGSLPLLPHSLDGPGLDHYFRLPGGELIAMAPMDFFLLLCCNYIVIVLMCGNSSMICDWLGQWHVCVLHCRLVVR